MSSLRDSLNKVNTVFSEDTQRGTDRIVRIILQGAYCETFLPSHFLSLYPSTPSLSPSHGFFTFFVFTHFFSPSTLRQCSSLTLFSSTQSPPQQQPQM